MREINRLFQQMQGGLINQAAPLVNSAIERIRAYHNTELRIEYQQSSSTKNASPRSVAPENPPATPRPSLSENESNANASQGEDLTHEEPPRSHAFLLYQEDGTPINEGGELTASLQRLVTDLYRFASDNSNHLIRALSHGADEARLNKLESIIKHRLPNIEIKEEEDNSVALASAANTVLSDSGIFEDIPRNFENAVLIILNKMASNEEITDDIKDAIISDFINPFYNAEREYVQTLEAKVKKLNTKLEKNKTHHTNIYAGLAVGILAGGLVYFAMFYGVLPILAMSALAGVVSPIIAVAGGLAAGWAYNCLFSSPETPRIPG